MFPINKLNHPISSLFHAPLNVLNGKNGFSLEKCLDALIFAEKKHPKIEILGLHTSQKCDTAHFLACFVRNIQKL